MRKLEECTFEKQLIGAKHSMDILNADKSTRLAMLVAVHRQHNVPTGHLMPTGNNVDTKTMTDSLNDYGTPLSTITANMIMARLGLIETKTRKTSGGRTRSYKVLNDAGLKYGINRRIEKIPSETQPLYCVETFGELLKRMKEVME